MSRRSAGTFTRFGAVTLLQGSLLAVALGLGGVLLVRAGGSGVAQAQGPVPTPSGPPPFGRGFGQQEQPLLARFDTNGTRRLEADERKAAREWLAANGTGRRGFGGRGGRGLQPSSPGRTLGPADVPAYASEPLYDEASLRTVFLQFENADWEEELAAFHNTDVEVPATAVVDGRRYPNVGVHFRGMSSFMMVPAGLKRSLNLSFDFVDGKQTLYGYRTLNLLNANGDPTFVRGTLYSQIARSYLPAPKANFMRVAINGESWGIYVNAQQFNRDFLRDYFGTEKGARWKVPGSPGGRGGMEYLGPDVAAYKRIYEIKTKDDPKPWADLIAMFRVLNETPPDELEAALSPLLDIDGVLKFLAIEMALVNTDGYWTRASDYNIYQDAKGQFHVIPHDMNEALVEEGGRGRRGGFRGPPPDFGRGFPPDGPAPFAPDGARGAPPPGFGRAFGPGAGGPELDPLIGLDDPTKPLRSKLLAVPRLRARYLSFVRDIAQRWLDWSVLEPQLKRHQALIADEVKLDTRKLYSYDEFTSALTGPENSLKAFVTKRRAYLLNFREPAADMK